MDKMKLYNKSITCLIGTTVTLCLLSGCASNQDVISVGTYQPLLSGQVQKGTSNDGKSLPVLDDHSSLDDYLVYAALNNSEMEAAFNRWKASLLRVTQAKSLPDPRFTYGYFIREVETRVGSQQHRVGLSQMFPWFGKLRLRSEIALQEAKGAQEDYESEKLKLFYQVKDAYYELYYLWRAIGITEDNIQLLKHIEGVAQTKYRAGAPLSGVIKAQIELGKLDDQRKQLTDMLEPITARLNAALNRKLDVSLPPLSEITDSTVVFDDAQLSEWLEVRNPQLRKLDAIVMKQQRLVSLAKKDWFPDVTFGVDYIDTSEALSPGVMDSGKDPILATISFNLPIWMEKNRAAIREAKALREAAVNARTSRQNLLAVDLKLAAYKYRDASRKIDLYENTLIPQAKQALSVAEQAYEAGKVDFLELIDAQRLLLEFQLQYQRARTTHEQRIAEIEMLIARRLPQLSAESSFGSDAVTQKE